MSTIRGEVDRVFGEITEFLNASSRVKDEENSSTEIKCNNLALFIIQQASETVKNNPLSFAKDAVSITYSSGIKTTVSDIKMQSYRILDSLQSSWSKGKNGYSKPKEYAFEVEFFYGLIEKLHYEGQVMFTSNDQNKLQGSLVPDFLAEVKWELSHIRVEKPRKKEKSRKCTVS